MSGRNSQICADCKVNGLWTEIERDVGICGHCADRMYERGLERREWAYYHPPLDDDEIAHTVPERSEK